MGTFYDMSWWPTTIDHIRTVVNTFSNVSYEMGLQKNGAQHHFFSNGKQ